MSDLTILLLFVAGLGLFWLEMYVPGGVIGVAGIAAILAGIVLTFAQHGIVAGASTSAAVLTVTVLMMRHWMHGFSRSFFGSQMTNRDVSGKNDFVDDTRALVGQRGITVSRVQPGGKAQFGDRRLDVIAQLGAIEPGIEVEIIRVDGIAIVVRAIPAANGD
jgi:membrane-bound serine protease (ClpP class)